MTALPSWIPQEHWDAWIAMRKKIKKPATDFACTLAIKELYELKAKGHDPVKCLEQSILKCWLAFYPPRQGEQAAVNPEVAKTKAALQADELSARGITREDLAENARKARERFGRKPQQGELH